MPDKSMATQRRARPGTKGLRCTHPPHAEAHRCRRSFGGQWASDDYPGHVLVSQSSSYDDLVDT